MTARRQGIDAPTVQLATWYNRRNALGTSTPMAAALDSYREQLELSRLSVLSKSDEAALKVLRDNGYTRPIIQYVLFTEISFWSTDGTGAFTNTVPRNNNWCFGSIPWRTAIEYDPTAFLHLAPVTVSAAASAGAPSVSVPDLAKFQKVGSGSKGIVDVWSSGGTYLGVFQYTAKSADTGSGTLTVPASGYGSIGFNPTSLAGVGGTNPQTGTPWVLPTLASIPSGAILRGRVRSGAVSQSSNTPNTGNHFFMIDPSSASVRAWLKASLSAYRVSTLSGSSPTNLWGTGTGNGGAGTGHVFLDNLHTDPVKFTGNLSGTHGNTPAFAMPTPIGGSAWTVAQWDDAHADLMAWLVTNMPGVWWGNAFPIEWGTLSGEITERAAQLAQTRAYRTAGINGVMLENFPLAFPSGSLDYLTQAEFDGALSFCDTLLGDGLELLLVGQSLTTGTPWTDTAGARFTAAVALLLQTTNPPRVYARFASAGMNGAYPQYWPFDEWRYRLGRPIGARSTSGTNPKIYTRDYQYGSVSISYPTSGTPTVTISRSNG